MRSRRSSRAVIPQGGTLMKMVDFKGAGLPKDDQCRTNCLAECKGLYTVSSFRGGSSFHRACDFFISYFHDRKVDQWNYVSSPARTEILREGFAVDAVYFLETGVVKLTMMASNGHEVIAGIRKGSWLLGATATILGEPSFLTVTTLTQCSMLSIPAKTFLHMVEADCEFSDHVHRLQSRKIADQMHRLVDMMSMTAEERLACLFCGLIRAHGPEPCDGSSHIELPLQHQEIAQIIAVTPEHLSRIMKRMEKKGLIRRKKDVLVMTDPQGLLKDALG